jgi:hypothetical protein
MRYHKTADDSLMVPLSCGSCRELEGLYDAAGAEGGLQLVPRARIKVHFSRKLVNGRKLDAKRIAMSSHVCSREHQVVQGAMRSCRSRVVRSKVSEKVCRTLITGQVHTISHPSMVYHNDIDGT